MEEGKEIVQAEQQKSPAAIMQMALDKGIDVDKLDKMLDMQERWDKTEALKAYNMAMAQVHKNMPEVKKTEKNSQTSSKYAALDGVINVAKPVYSNEGFSVSFYEGDTALENHVRVCIDVTHQAGHKESYHYDMPLDGKGIKGNVNMTPIHAKASSVSYGRRYLLCMVFNIPTGDDDDGNAAGTSVEYIGDSELSQIKDYTDNFKVFDEAVFLKYIKVESFEKIEKKDFNKVLIALETKKKQEEK